MGWGRWRAIWKRVTEREPSRRKGEGAGQDWGREGVRRGELMRPRLGKEGLVEVCGDHQPRHVGK